MKPAKPKTIAIIGAGPVGLAAAAHALKRNLQPVVFESGPQVAHAIRQWGHVSLFSPWKYLIDPTARRLLETTNWQSPDPTGHPTGSELVTEFLAPLAELTPLKHHIKTSSTVTAIGRRGIDKLKTEGRGKTQFEVRYNNNGQPLTLLADAVIDASGTWFAPNPAGANGLPACGEAEAAARISYSMPDVPGAERERFAGKRVAVLGAGHAAIGTLVDLAHLAEQRPETRVVWLVRANDPQRAFGGGADDQLAARGALGSRIRNLVTEGRIQVETGFRVAQISSTADGLRVTADSSSGERHIDIDELIVATGFRPDFSFARELRLNLDPALECPPMLAPLIDPNEHSCGTVRPHGARELAQPEPGFYIAGMKSYGRAPTFLTITGYEQVRSIMADIVGDREAAESVELVLPETGVCSGPPDAQNDDGVDVGGCCGGPPVFNTDACCVLDEQAKEDGEAGCGCSATEPTIKNSGVGQ